MTIKQFRIFLTLSWLFAISYMVVAFSTIDALPKELSDYLMSRTNPMKTNMDVVYFVSGFPLIIGIIVAYIGLYFWKNWARILFVCVFLYSFIVQLIGNSPTIISPIAEPFYILSNVLSGIVICSMFYCEKVGINFTKNGKTQQEHSR